MKTISFTVNEEGKVFLDQSGYVGETCATELQRLLKIAEEEYGLKITSKVERKKVQTAGAVRQGVTN